MCSAKKGVFSRERARKILEDETKIGLKGHFHGDMMNYMDFAMIPGEVENYSFGICWPDRN
jgi:hypothetical protein